MRRTKTGRQPPGVLLVPVLKAEVPGDESGEKEVAPVPTDDDPTEETPAATASDETGTAVAAPGGRGARNPVDEASGPRTTLPATERSPAAEPTAAAAPPREPARD